MMVQIVNTTSRYSGKQTTPFKVFKTYYDTDGNLWTVRTGLEGLYQNYFLANCPDVQHNKRIPFYADGCSLYLGKYQLLLSRDNPEEKSAEEKSAYKSAEKSTEKSAEESVMKFAKKSAMESDGGPSEYYDFPQQPKTLNDLIEHKNMDFHRGNVFKAAYRLGGKSGTSEEYDHKKIIYSGCRMLMKQGGAANLRAYLQNLLDDPQFNA